MRWLLLFGLVGSGCESAAESSAPTEDSRTAPDAWSWEDTATGTPVFDGEAFATDLLAHLAAMYVVKATTPLDSFVAAYAYATPTCPNRPVTTVSAQYGTTLYFDGLCEDEAVDFKGPGIYYTWENQEINPVAAMESAGALPPGILWSGHGFNGQTDIYSDDGALDYNCSCTMVDASGEDSSGTNWFFGITQGTAHWTGPEGAGTWMDDPAVVPEVQIVVNENKDIRGIRAGGTLSGIGDRYSAMGWQLSLNAGIHGGKWDCSPDSTLTVDYRDNLDAVWYALDMTVDNACEACGAATDGTNVCIDLNPTLDFETSPWL